VQQAASGIDRRNLRGRCGGSRVWRRKPPALRHDEPFRMLASSGTGIEVRSGQRGANLSIAKLPPFGKQRRDEGSTAGEPRGQRKTGRPRAGFSEGRKHPDCRDGAPLRGGSRDGDLGWTVMRKVLQPSELMPPGDHGVLDSLRRRGTSRHSLRLARSGYGVPSLLAGRPAFAQSHCLTHPRRNRRWTRGVASHAALRGAVAFGAPPFGGLVPSGRQHRWCGVARCLPFLGRGRAVARRAQRRKRTGSEGQRIGTGSTGALRPVRARIGRSRSCSRVVDVVAEVDRRCFGAEKRTLSISPDLEAFRDGRLARGPTCEST